MKWNAKRVQCLDCEEELELRVCRSAAGWYAGFWCDICGPGDRVSSYFKTEAEAQRFAEKVTNDKVKSYWEDQPYTGF